MRYDSGRSELIETSAGTRPSSSYTVIVRRPEPSLKSMPARTKIQSVTGDDGGKLPQVSLHVPDHPAIFVAQQRQGVVDLGVSGQ